MRVTVGIPTKGRYDLLAMTLQSLAVQTYKQFDVIVIDDSDEPKDLRELPVYQGIFHVFNHYGIGWRVVFGRKLGQHHSHQLVQDEAKTEWIWRIDDDEMAEPDTLFKLFMHTRASLNLGAVGGLVTIPPGGPCPPHAGNVITDLNRPNLQWFERDGEATVGVDHLTSSFLYKKGVAKYEMGLSPAAHREETMLTYEIKRAGYKVLFDPKIRTWHFRAGHGGIRSHQDVRYWDEDEKLFQEKLREWGVNGEPHKTVVLDCGKGDEVVVKSLIPDLKRRYGEITIACCSPEIFEGDGCTLISIAEAKQTLGNIDRHNIYRHCIDLQHKGELREAFKSLYGV